jgi:uncharacterized membrane protein
MIPYYIAGAGENKMTQSRNDSIDLLRGVVMIIMVLDHVRDFVHYGAGHYNPEDLTRTTAAIFLTRWITHFCAPVFMFTAGLGAFFKGQKSRDELSMFLLTRGLWLMLLEVTVLRFAFYFNFRIGSGPFLLTILWGLGLSMVALAALVYLPRRLLAAVSILMILCHNLLDSLKITWPGWVLVHQPGPFKVGSTVVIAVYPLIPWVGVMAAGYCLGEVFLMDEARRRRILVRLGIALTLAFFVVRGVNHYGDPVAWSHQASPLFTVLSFLRCLKYPPSLDFLLMTLGPAITLLGLLGGVKVDRRNPVLIFGRVPMFFFLAHIFLIHIVAMVLAFFRYGTARFFLNGPPSMGTPAQLFPADYGYALWVTYAVWLVVVALLYPLCLWFAGLKQRRHDWWLGYL